MRRRERRPNMVFGDASRMMSMGTISSPWPGVAGGASGGATSAEDAGLEGGAATVAALRWRQLRLAR